MMIKLSRQLMGHNSTKVRHYVSNNLRIVSTHRNYSSSYEGDGKTTVKVLNNDAELGLMVNSFSEVGFRLNNKFNIVGPMVIFPRTVLSWNVNSVEDINEHSLRLMLVVEPKLELLVIGIGNEEVTPDLINRITQIVKPYHIRVEILKTEAACTTFNFMNAESRYVAAAMIPPKKIKFNDMDLLAAGERYKQLYGPDENTVKKITS